MAISPALREAIGKIPGEDGWYKSRGQDIFERLAGELLGYGLTEEQALDVLGWAYGAVSNEFGA